MKYLCLVYTDEQRLATLSGSEWDALVIENLELCEELRQSGHYVSASPLESTQTAVTVRMRSGKLSTSDGPFAETKEQLGGYYLVEARDLNEAIQIAGRIPGGAPGERRGPADPGARPPRALGAARLRIARPRGRRILAASSAIGLGSAALG